jgi:hypothetical protein
MKFFSFTLAAFLVSAVTCYPAWLNPGDSGRLATSAICAVTREYLFAATHGGDVDDLRADTKGVPTWNMAIDPFRVLKVAQHADLFTPNPRSKENVNGTGGSH